MLKRGAVVAVVGVALGIAVGTLTGYWIVGTPIAVAAVVGPLLTVVRGERS